MRCEAAGIEATGGRAGGGDRGDRRAAAVGKDLGIPDWGGENELN
jgi:hypothetical protein